MIILDAIELDEVELDEIDVALLDVIDDADDADYVDIEVDDELSDVADEGLELTDDELDDGIGLDLDAMLLIVDDDEVEPFRPQLETDADE